MFSFSSISRAETFNFLPNKLPKITQVEDMSTEILLAFWFDLWLFLIFTEYQIFNKQF